MPVCVPKRSRITKWTLALFNQSQKFRGQISRTRGLQQAAYPGLYKHSAFGSARIRRLFILPTLVLTKVLTKRTCSNTP